MPPWIWHCKMTRSSRNWWSLGAGFGLVHEWKLARAAFKSAVELDEKNADAWAWLGEADQQTDSSDGGTTELEQALTLDPDSATVRGLRGLYFQRIGNFPQALTEFQAAAALEPENPTWLVSVGEAYSKKGDLIRALEVLSNCDDTCPGRSELLALAGNFLRAE